MMFDFVQYHSGAVALIVLSYLFPALWSYRNRTWSGFFALSLVATAHHVLSLINRFVSTLPGTEFDAKTFHINAIATIKKGAEPSYSIGTEIYETILIYSYKLFGKDMLVGQSISILVVVFSLMVMASIARHIGLRERWIPLLIVIVGLMPSSLFFGSFTFREPFQLFGITLGVGFALFAIRDRSVVHLLVSIIGFFFMGVFHHVLLGMALLLIISTVLLYLYRQIENKSLMILYGSIALLVLSLSAFLVMTIVPAQKGNDYIAMLNKSGGIPGMVERYRSDVEKSEPRSSYGFSIDATSLSSFSVGVIRSYTHYLVGPFPGDLDSVIDVVPWFDALIRQVSLLLIFSMLLLGISRPPGYIYLLFVYVAITFMWSLGTTNYGQAIRHHAITDWIIVLIGLIALQNIIAWWPDRSRPETSAHPRAGTASSSNHPNAGATSA